MTMNFKEYDKVEMGERIRKARECKGFSQESLAALLGITPKFVRDIECGNKGISMKNFVLLIQVLDTSADYLLLGEPERQQKKLVCEVKFFLT